MGSPRFFNGLLSAGLLSTLVFGGLLAAGLLEIFRGDPGHNWTHRDMRMTLPESRDWLEIYVGGELLQAHLERKSLATAGPDGTSYPVLERDIRVRRNNWLERKTELALRAIPEAFLCGLSLACLAMGVFRRRRGETPCAS